MTRPAPAAPTGLAGDGFRTDVHGLRGVALALVVGFHVLADGRVSGGIDVFLALTGYFAAQSLLRRADRGDGRIQPVAHLRRLAARLLPPLLVTLVAVGVATAALLPPDRWAQVGRELRASALYYENLELIRSQLGYEAAGPASSPLQHIWSLSVQGQFHLLWVVLVVLALAVARASGVSRRAVVLVVAAVTATASFAWAVHLTAVDQQVAYLHTTTRLWQPALGAAAAVVLPHVRLRPAVAAGAAWAGLAMIVSTGFWLDGARLFPGPAALWPVGGLLLVLAGGGSALRWAPDRLLTARLARFVADISYSLYLWHWPVLVLTVQLAGLDRPGPREALFVLTLSVLLAWVTTRGVAVARRLSPRRRAPRIALGTAGLVLVVGSVSGAGLAVEHREQRALEALARDDVGRPGAWALAAGHPVAAGPRDREQVIPPLDVVQRDLPRVYAQGCIQGWPDDRAYDAVLVCEDEDAPPRAPRVVMSGGSHVVQWWPALREVADAAGWELLVVDKDGCRLSAQRQGRPGSARETSCDRWNDAVLGVLVDLAPDLLVTLGSTTEGMRERTPPGFVTVWEELAEAGIPVLALRDTPRFDSSRRSCLHRSHLDAVLCGQERHDVLSPDFPLVEAPPTVTWLDLTDHLCTADLCPAVVGDVVVYRDSNHLSATYVRTVTPFLERELRVALPELFADSPG